MNLNAVPYDPNAYYDPNSYRMPPPPPPPPVGPPSGSKRSGQPLAGLVQEKNVNTNPRRGQACRTYGVNDGHVCRMCRQMNEHSVMPLCPICDDPSHFLDECRKVLEATPEVAAMLMEKFWFTYRIGIYPVATRSWKWWEQGYDLSKGQPLAPEQALQYNAAGLYHKFNYRPFLQKQKLQNKDQG